MVNHKDVARRSRLLFFCVWLSLPLWAQAPVRSAPVSELLIYPQRSAPAQVVSLNDSQISAELTARIASIDVRVGDQVQQGALLVALDCRTSLSELAQRKSAIVETETHLVLTDSQLQRALQLRQQRNISDEELDRRKAEHLMLNARRETLAQQQRQAELQVERCSILAPFAGVVRERMAQLGELTTPGRGLIRLQQVDAVEVSAQIAADTDLSGVESLFFEYQGRRYPLALRRSLPVVDSRARTRELRLIFSGDASPPGSSGRLVWAEAAGRLPGYLLVRRDDQLGVMLATDGRAHFQPLPGAEEGQPVLVALPPESRVVVTGRHGLSEGDSLVETR